MTIEEAKERILALARGELCYHETGDNQTKYAQNYSYDTKLYGFDMNGLPWCDYFVDWLFIVAFGFEIGSSMTYQYAGCSGASCASSAHYYQEHGAYSQKAEVGDQIFFYVDGGINHTGIVEEINGDSIVTIEGNSSDQVKRTRYSRYCASIAGYGHPAWKYAANVSKNAGCETEDAAEEEETVRDTGLEVDGIAGPATWTALAGRMPTCLKGSMNMATAALQAMLNQLGADLDCDGEFGPLTDAELRRFQEGRL